MTYVFKIDDYIVDYTYHYNGKLVQIERKDHDYIAVLGITTHSCYSLYDFTWKDMEDDLLQDEDYEEPYYDSDIEKAATILVNSINGGSIGDKSGEIYLSYAMSEFLIIFTIDLLSGDDMSWITDDGDEDNNDNTNDEDREFIFTLTPEHLEYKGKVYPFPLEDKINSYEFRSILNHL